MAILAPGDRIVMHRSDLVLAAKAHALNLISGYAPPPPGAIRLTGAPGYEAIMVATPAESLSPHNPVVARILAEVLTGGPEVVAGTVVDEAGVMVREPGTVVTLVRDPATQARIAHMLATGKLLRN